jgi:hypothetical protein
MLKTLVIVVALTGTVRAQPATIEPLIEAAIAHAVAHSPTVEAAVRGTVHRARRAISIGPTVGVWSAALLDPGTVDAALTFGLGLETFKVPVLPSRERLQQLLLERLKGQLRDRIAQAFANRIPDPIELQRLAAEVYADVYADLVSTGRPRTMERPSLTLGFEANRMFAAERWLGRARIGFGVWRVTLGASVAAGRVCRGGMCDDGVKMFAGPEVVAHFLTSKGPRAPVVDTFVRVDFQASGRGTETYDQLVVGARFLLDAI